jgi:hypothetical protein
MTELPGTPTLKSRLNIRCGSVPVVITKTPQPVQLVTRSVQVANIAGPSAVCGRHSGDDAALLVANCKLPLELTFTLVYVCP